MEANSAETSAQALRDLAVVVKERLAPALTEVSSWASAAKELRLLMDDAWASHAAAGRMSLESFYQGVCFEAVEGFLNSGLYPDHVILS